MVALSWSGGKDSTLALDRALDYGLDVRVLFNIYEGISGRVRFHGVRRELIRAQADALGLELLDAHTHPADFEAVFDGVLAELRGRGVDGVAFGNLHLDEIRGWYEARTRARGFQHYEPLWHVPPARVLETLLARGYRAIVVSVDLERARPDWLGRDLDPDLITELVGMEGIDAAGEQGEYHTFVYDGPLFRRPVAFRTGRVHRCEGHALLDLLPDDGSCRADDGR